MRICNLKLDLIAVHTQVEAGRFSTRDEDIPSERRTLVERGSVWMLNQIRHIGEQTTNWAESLLVERGVESLRVLQGLLSLTKWRRSIVIERACEVALSHEPFACEFCEH